MKALPILQEVVIELLATRRAKRLFVSDETCAFLDGSASACVYILRHTLPRCSKFVRAKVGAAIRERLNLEGRAA